MICEGFLLRRHRINEKSETINWVCKQRFACPGSVTINAKSAIVRRVAHKIVTEADATEDNPNHEPLTELETLARDFKNQVKIRCSTEADMATVKKICQEERSKLSATFNHSNEELTNALPDVRSMRSGLYKRKKAKHMTIPAFVRNIVLEGGFSETINSKNSTRRCVKFRRSRRHRIL